ncbi:MAG: DUF6273 domain-containing protein [Oscillospiraceae bacterium]|nr:DUF6273 domain-containing protein [Oscillospiraceae bacterium]
MKAIKRILSVFFIVLLLVTSVPAAGFEGLFETKAEAAVSMKDKVASMSVGETVTFGSYPQTDVTSKLGAELTKAAPDTDDWISYNYYYDGKQSDYMKYYDLTYKGSRYRGVYFTKYRPRYWYDYDTYYSYQPSNGYYTKKIYWFRYDPLTWRILDPSTGYVLCENIIDSQAFNNEYYTNGTCDFYGQTAYYNDETYTNYANNWEYSTIRTWLNESFFVTAFSMSERSQIPCTKLTTPAYSTSYSDYDVGETGDYVFLPSYQDMINPSYLFSSYCSDYDMDRRAHSSDYAKSQGVEVSGSYEDKYGKHTSYYCLRSAGDSSGYTTEVNDDGYVYDLWYTNVTSSGIRPALCFNPSSTGTYSNDYDKKVTINVYSKDSYDVINKVPLVNVSTKLTDFTVTTSSESKVVSDASKVKIKISEAKKSGVKISKDYYCDYIIPAEIFENIFNEGFSAKLDVKMSALPKHKAGYISTAFVKEDGEYDSYTDTITGSVNITKGNKYKVILSAAGVGKNVKYYLSQDELHKIESDTGVFEGDLFSDFSPYKDVYAYAVSSKGTTVLSKLQFNIIPAVENKKIDDFIKSNSTNLLGEAPTSVTGKVGNFLFDGAKIDLSAFKIPVSTEIDGNTIKVAIGIDDFFTYTPGKKKKNDGEWSNFVKDYKKYFESDHSWTVKKEEAKKANKKAKQLSEKYGKNKWVKSKKHNFSLDVVGYGVWELVRSGSEWTIKFKEGSAAVTGSANYKYTQNGFVAGAVPAYAYFGFDTSVSASAKITKDVSDYSVPLQWEFSLSLKPKLTIEGGVGIKDLLSAGLYGTADASVFLKPAFNNETGNFKLDVEGEIGVKANAGFIFEKRVKIIDGKVNIINKTWSNTKKLKAYSLYIPHDVSGEESIPTREAVNDVESVDRSYASKTSEWLGTKSFFDFKSRIKSKSLDLSGMTYTTLQENVFYAPQQQIAVVGDKALMVYVEDDGGRSANNRMRLMYTLYDFSSDSWSLPKPVSDDGRNDSYPCLVSDGDNTYIAWIKANTLYDDNLSNAVDVYRACEVYYAKFDSQDETFTDVTRITNDDVYDYNPTVSIDYCGNPVVYYASCTDNDTYGQNNTITKYTEMISLPETSTDSDTSEVYNPSAEHTAIKTVIESGKYYILSMTANSDADELTYIMDKNGNTSDSSGVNAYTISNGTTTEIDHETAISDAFYANLNGEEKLLFSDRSNIYYLNDNGEETAVLDSDTSISSVVFPIETDDGLSFMFTKNDGDSSELFYVSQTENGWSAPVQISNVGKKIENVAVAYRNNRLYGSITTKENDETDIVGFKFNEFTDVSLGDIFISELETSAGEDNKFSVAVFNNGTSKIDSIDFTVSDTIGTDSKQTVEADIKPGDMKLVELTYPAPEDYRKTTLTVTADITNDRNTDDNTVSKAIGLPEVMLDEPISEEFADYYVVTTYAENFSDITASNVSVTVKQDDNSIADPINFDEIALLQREAISVVIPKSSVTYDKDGFASITISALCGENSDEVTAILTDNSKDENGECTHIETIIKETPSTCISEGKAETVCASCGEVLGTIAVYEKSGHTIAVDDAVGATCTTTGKTEGEHCTVCGKVLTAQEVIDALGHTEVTIPGKPATCTEKGLTDGVECSVCGEILTEQTEIPAAGHKETVIKGKPAACTQDGLTDGVECSVCGEILTAQKEIPMLGHKSETVNGKSATCTEKGLTDGVKCSECGIILIAQKEIPASGHKFENGKCTVCSASDPDYKPAEKPAEKPTEAPAEKPTDNTTKPAEKPTSPVTEKPTEKPTENPNEPTTNKPDEPTTKPDGKKELSLVEGCKQVLDKVKKTVSVVLEKASGMTLDDFIAMFTDGIKIENDKNGLVYNGMKFKHGDDEYTVIVKGDTEADGKITAADARRILRISARLESPDEVTSAAADIDSNSKISAAEARAVLRYAARLSKSLESELPK